MNNINLRERLNKTPLTPNRFLILIWFVFDAIFTVAFALFIFKVGNIDLVGNILILYSSLSIVLLACLAGLDYRNRVRWIQDRILFKVPFEPTIPTWLDRFQDLDRLIWLKPILMSYLPFVAIWIWLAFFMPNHDPKIDLLMFLLVIPATIFYRTKKRIFDQRFTIQLADIGMIYNDHVVLWSDSITSAWIDRLVIHENDSVNGTLEIEMALRNVNEKPKIHRIPLPPMSESQRQDILDKIQEGNAMNTAKSRKGRRFY